MPTVKKEALNEAVGEALDSLFDGQGSGSRTMSFVPNENGEFVISEPLNVEESQPFVEALEGYLEEEEVRKMDEAARESMRNCGICEYCLRMPCVASSEYSAMMEIGESMEEERKPNSEIRFALYRHMSTAYFGHLGAGVRRELPVCVVGEIHDAYPSEGGRGYVGFKASADNTSSS